MRLYTSRLSAKLAIFESSAGKIWTAWGRGSIPFGVRQIWNVHQSLASEFSSCLNIQSSTSMFLFPGSKLRAIRQLQTMLAGADPGALVKSDDKKLALKYAVRRNETYVTVLNYFEARKEYMP